MLAGMVPAALAEVLPQETPSTEQTDPMEETTPPEEGTTEPSEEEPTTLSAPAGDAATTLSTPNTSTEAGFREFVAGKIAEANRATGTNTFMTLEQDATQNLITVDLKKDKLETSLMSGDDSTSITGTGLIDLIFEVVKASDNCTLEVVGESSNTEKKIISGSTVEKDPLKLDILMVCVAILAKDPAVMSDSTSIGTLVGHSLDVAIKLKTADGTAADTITYTFEFVCSDKTLATPDKPVFAEEGDSAVIEEKTLGNEGKEYCADYTLKAAAPAHMLYRVYDAETGNNQVPDVSLTSDGAGASNTAKVTLRFEADAIPEMTTTYYIGAELFGVPSEGRTPITVVVLNDKDVTKTADVNLATIKATVSGEGPYSITITGTDLAPGLEPFNTTELQDIYNLFNPKGGNWDKIPKEARNGEYTIVTLDFPAAPYATGTTITQSSKALKEFYCDGLSANATSTIDSRITVDNDGNTATKTDTYTADKYGKISLTFLIKSGDPITFTVKHDQTTTVTYNVTGTLTFTPAENGDTVVDATPTVSNNTATANPDPDDISSAATVAAGAADAKDKVVTIDATASTGGTSVKKAEVTIPNAAITKVDEKKVALTVNTDVGGVTLPAEAVAAIKSDAGSANVTISLEKKDTPSTGAKASFEFTITKANSDAVTVKQPMTLSFNVGKDLVNPKVYFNNGGKLELLGNQHYDEKTGILTAVTTHNSLYDVRDSGCAITLGSATSGGIGQKRDVTVALGATYTSSGAYLTVQATDNQGKNMFFTTKVTGASSTVPISYVSGGTVKAWLTENMPNISQDGGVTGKILDAVEE